MKNRLNVAVAMVLATFFVLDNEVFAKEPPMGPAYSLSVEKSTLHWKGTKPGGGHYGVVEMVQGDVVTDGKTITGGSFTIHMNTIECHDLDNEAMNARLVSHLKSEDFFHVEKYPEALFRITDVRPADHSKDGKADITHTIDGELTIKGITRAISFPARISPSGNTLFATTQDIVLDRTQWNVNHMSKKVFSNLADRFIDDEMIISLDLRFTMN